MRTRRLGENSQNCESPSDTGRFDRSVYIADFCVSRIHMCYARVEYFCYFVRKDDFCILQKHCCINKGCKLLKHFVEKVDQLEDEVSRLQKSTKLEKEEWTEEAKRYKEKESKKVYFFYFGIYVC